MSQPAVSQVELFFYNAVNSLISFSSNIGSHFKTFFKPFSEQSLYRSEDMTHVAITMTNESAHSTVRQLGNLECCHFVDLSLVERQQSKQLQHYKKRVADCIYWEKKLQKLQTELLENGIVNDSDCILDVPDNDDDFDITSNRYSHNIQKHMSHADIIDASSQFFTPIEHELSVNAAFLAENSAKCLRLTQQKHVLTALSSVKIAEEVELAKQEFGDTQISNGESSSLLNDDVKPLESAPPTRPDRFRSVIAGVLPTEQQHLFTRMLYRVSRGNAFARFHDIEDENEKHSAIPVAESLLSENENNTANTALQNERMSVFYVVLLGEQLNERVRRMCDLFRAQIYSIPTSHSQYQSLIDKITSELTDSQSLASQTSDTIYHQLKSLGIDSDGIYVLREWLIAIQTERKICEQMMKAHFYLTMITLEAWIPTNRVSDLRTAVKQAVSGTGNVPAAIEIDPISPILPGTQTPTHFQLNKFTSTFQSIVDTYGVPRYKEVNPGLFTIISFPFLFGVMYGDIFHGSFLLLFSFTMIYFEKQLLRREKMGTLGEIPSMAFGGRYALLCMGTFAIYCGMIYNDFASIPLNVWGSRYTYHQESNSYTKAISNYPIGIDPIWAHKSNELAFSNSLKMKMAIIFGVVQMTFGIFLSASNHLYFGDKLSLYFEFIPRLFFLLCTFGYMSFLILLKWSTDYSGRTNDAPNLLQTMISMFLGGGVPTPLYVSQSGIQLVLLLIAFFCVPVMLFVKPILSHRASQQRQLLIAQARNSIDETENHEQHSLGDELIHNAIHTIEFVLGAVSNTASYLRLWALSLAHAQLAGVFWEKMFAQYGYEAGALNTVVGFAIWAAATFAVLLAMDVLECFLHALRLHWVEFQSKFYFADGVAFKPFTFSQQKGDL